MKNIKTTLLKAYAYISIALAYTVCGITPAYAGDDIFAVGGALSDNLMNQIKEFYCNKLFVLLLVVNLVLLAFTKNEKRIEIYKKSLIIIVVVYVALYFAGSITTYIDTILNNATATP